MSRAVGNEFLDGVHRGAIIGLEDSINQPNGEAPGWVVGNALLSLKADVIVVNSSVWLGLDTSQQSSLQRAAARTTGGHGQACLSISILRPRLKPSVPPALATWS